MRKGKFRVLLAAFVFVSVLLAGCGQVGESIPEIAGAVSEITDLVPELSRAREDLSEAAESLSSELEAASGESENISSELEAEISRAAESLSAEMEAEISRVAESFSSELEAVSAEAEKHSSGPEMENSLTEKPESRSSLPEEETSGVTEEAEIQAAQTYAENAGEDTAAEGITETENGKKGKENSRTGEKDKGDSQSGERKGTVLAAGQTSEAVEEVIVFFEKLAAIPRPSGHEKKVSDYLYAWAEKAGKNARQDSYGNVIVDIPASKGCERKPLTVLQSHMDMVAAAEEGFAFDPLKDPVKVIRTETGLSADRTSLGADDGIGVAISQYLAENGGKHGPLRLIITTDEEVNQTGVKNLDPETVADASYLINIDWEESDSMCVTSASSVQEEFSRECEWVENPYNNPVELRVFGGQGGHSGQEIDKGRANANIVMADLLTALKKAGVRYCLASFEGGTAGNAIAASAKAVITVHEEDSRKMEEETERFRKNLKKQYAGTDPGMDCEVLYPNLLVQEVLPEKDRDRLLTLLTNLISGVYTMSSDVENFVESSENVGIVKIKEGETCSVVACTRSSQTNPGEHIVNAQELLAASLGFSCEAVQSCESWAYDPENPLAELAAEVYLEQNGAEMKEQFTHAGLECGTFKKYNSELKMISVGPDVTDPHTPKETVSISSIGVTLNLISGILERIAE